MVNFHTVDIQEFINKVKANEVDLEGYYHTLFATLKKVDTKIHAFLHLTENEAERKIKEIKDKIRSNKPLGALAGIPVAVKDNICMKGVKTTCASKILENYTSPYDATVIEKLRASDAIIVGKTNLDEFAMGSSTENSAFCITRNPWDKELSRVPGGSSGGSAAIVATGIIPIALGSDTGGSIRQPASFCGIVGMKPTYGRVSRYGLVAFASSLDQIGPFGIRVYDTALLLETISGYDEKDSTCINLPVPPYTKLLSDRVYEEVKNIKAGLPKEYFIEGMDKEVKEKILSAVDTLAKLGVKVEEISLPHTEYALAVYYIIAPSEASANLARYDGVKYGYRADGEDLDLFQTYMETRGKGFGAEVKRRIMLGTYALSSGYYDAYYDKARRVRTLIKQDFDKAFEKVDIILTPTSPTTAFRVGEKMEDPLTMYLSDIFTISCNLAGIPGMSICCGFDSNGLPVGLQILGRTFEEETILKIGYVYEQETKWYQKIPPIVE
jgi:aspartyl-tRNA(Asn)/glutamyl-tRNA(Gln) amidotransferase subunit A